MVFVVAFLVGNDGSDKEVSSFVVLDRDGGGGTDSSLVVVPSPDVCCAFSPEVEVEDEVIVPALAGGGTTIWCDPSAAAAGDDCVVGVGEETLRPSLPFFSFSSPSDKAIFQLFDPSLA